jgi:IS5 family transposase
MKPFKSSRTQKSFFDTQVYDRLIPRDHLLVKLNRVLDWSFIEIACEPFYSQLGRKGESPILLFKMLFLAYISNMSEREIEEHCNFNILFKHFLGLEIDQFAPDHSTLSKFRDRLGEEGFRQLFNRIVELARRQGVVADKLRIIDSTHMVAKVDIAQALSKAATWENSDHPANPILPASSDPDARFGAKSPTKKFYGYKHHMAVDADCDFITHSETSGGNLSDNDFVEPLLSGPPPSALTADKFYDTNANQQMLKQRGIVSHIARKAGRKDRPHSAEYHRALRLRKHIERVFSVCKNHHGGGRTRYWSLTKTTVQNLLISITYDLKVLAALLAPPAGPICQTA